MTEQDKKQQQQSVREVAGANDIIADTDLGQGPGNELGKYSANKAKLAQQPRVNPESPLSTDHADDGTSDAGAV